MGTENIVELCDPDPYGLGSACISVFMRFSGLITMG